MTSSEKVAYLKGLMEGMELNLDSGEGKLIGVIADILGTMAEDIEDIESDLYDVNGEMDALSDDVCEMEDLLDLFRERLEDVESGEDSEEESPVFFEVTCPVCNNSTRVDERVMAAGSVQCPQCGEMMEFGPPDTEDEAAD